MIKQTDEGIIFNVKIVPNSSKNGIVFEEEFIKIKLTAQPIEGKANKALIEFLSKELKIPKTSIEILKGECSKEKKLLVKTSDKEKINFVLAQLTKK